MSEYLQTVVDKFQLQVRTGYYYTEDGLWVSMEKGKAKIGVSDFTQRTGGDVAFAEFVEEGSTVGRHAEIGTLETAKTTISLLSPVSGTVERVNRTLFEKPELVNSDPYTEGWLLILVPHSIEEDLKALMSAEDYFRRMLKKLETEHTKLE